MQYAVPVLYRCVLYRVLAVPVLYRWCLSYTEYYTDVVNTVVCPRLSLFL
jgi:hypothetical protein